MPTLRTIACHAFAIFFVVAGINHFVNPDFYLQIIPPYLPWHDAINAVSGAAEVLLGILVAIPRTRRIGGWGSIALLIAIFPANLYVYAHQELIPATPLLHLLRLPLQLVFILWVYWAAGLSESARSSASAG